MKGKSIYILFLLLAISFSSFAQQGKADVEDADEHYKHGNFIMALPIYRDILKKEKNNRKIQFKLAMCYLNTNYNRTYNIYPYKNCFFIFFIGKNPTNKTKENLWN